MWWCMGLLVVPSCGYWVGSFRAFRVRYRLLWFWVFRWVFPYGSFGELGVEV